MYTDVTTPLSSWPARVLDTLTEAVVVVDATDAVVYTNAAGYSMLSDLGASGLPGVLPAPIADTLGRYRRGELEGDAAVESDQGQSWRVRAWDVDGHATALTCRRASTADDRVHSVRSELKITQREAELAIRATGGMSNRDIASHYEVPIGTVATRLWRLYRKLGVRNRAELAAAVASCYASADSRY